MILILSEDEDYITNFVIDWLTKEFKTIKNSNWVNSVSLILGETKCEISNKLSENITLDSNDVDSFWYRRSDFVYGINKDRIPNLYNFIHENIKREWDKLKYFQHLFLENKRSLGSYYKESHHSKLNTLFVAQIVGIKIPLTLITTNKNDLSAFKSKNGNCITKAIDRMFEIEDSGFFQSIGTKEVSKDMIDRLDETFLLTLFQKKINKAYELRIFYMRTQFFPMAIFSQKDKKTQLDYRNYNQEKPNRNIPYILPNKIQDKLQLLMDKLGLDSGSIDMIVTPEGEYVFLEVNPTGQFGWVSVNCNYYLEEKIANYLQGES